MRIVTKILIGFVLSLFLCVSSFAQIKIAVVNSDAFHLETTGIKKLVVAVREIGFQDFDELFQASKLESQIEVLENEIDVLPCDGESLNTKVKKLKELKNEFKATKEKLHQRYETYDAKNIEPIRVKIRAKLKDFAEQNGFKLVLDKSKLEDSNFFIIEDEPVDITKEFIKFCNEEFEKEKAQKQ